MVMFRVSSSTGVFGCMVDMLITICKAAGSQPLPKWVNDFLAIHLPHQSWMEQKFMDLTGSIGVPWSSKTMWSFSMVQCYIGFNWDLAHHTVALPLNRLSWILELLNHWILPGVTFSSCEAASLHSKLVHLSCIFPLICPFLWSAVAFPSLFRLPHTRLQVPPPLAADLSWVCFLAQNLLNQMQLASPQVIDLQW